MLLFYPGDNTPVCTRQFCSYRDSADDVGGLDAVIVGISGQDLDSHAAFVAKHGLNIPLLADTDGAVAKLYGTHAPVVGTRRAVIVIDEAGCVRARHDHRSASTSRTSTTCADARPRAGAHLNAFVAAGAGFLLAVLWFDLMFDVQVRGAAPAPGAVESIAAYYRRVTTAGAADEPPVALAMLATLAAIVSSSRRATRPWVGWRRSC